MDDAPKNPIVEMIEAIFKAIWEMLSAAISVIPTVLKFILWAVSAVFILPCVFVAGHIYPMWMEWGEDF